MQTLYADARAGRWAHAWLGEIRWWVNARRGLIVPLALWLAVATISCFGVYLAQRDRPPAVGGDFDPAVVIVPVRGVPAHLHEMWQSFCTQSYRPIRIIFAVESAADPAYAALKALAGGPPVEIVVAGLATGRGQKIHNMLAALGRLQPSDAVITFADADIAPDADWLVRLTRELDPRRPDMASGYRWLVPTDERWSTAFICVMNSSIATARRDPRWAHAWGGSMALRRPTLDALTLNKFWDRAVLDDLTLSGAVRASGGRVRSPRDVLLRTPASYGWKDGIAFARRQYLFARLHAPHLWVLAAGATTFPLLGWAVALPLAVTGDKIAIGVIIAANVLDHVRARLRARVPRKLWGTELPFRVALLDRWATPAWLAIHACLIWSTLIGRSITWGGRTYWIDAQQRLERIDTHSRLRK